MKGKLKIEYESYPHKYSKQIRDEKPDNFNEMNAK